MNYFKALRASTVFMSSVLSIAALSQNVFSIESDAVDDLAAVTLQEPAVEAAGFFYERLPRDVRHRVVHHLGAEDARNLRIALLGSKNQICLGDGQGERNVRLLWNEGDDVDRIVESFGRGVKFNSLSINSEFDAERASRLLSHSTIRPHIRNIHLRYIGYFSIPLDLPNIRNFAVFHMFPNLKEQRVQQFFSGDSCQGIRTILLSNCGLTAKGVEGISEAESFNDVNEFNLSNNRISDDGVVAISQCPGLQRLESLSLSNVRMTGIGFNSLLSSGKLCGLSKLDLSFHGLGDLALLAIVQHQGLQGLKNLSFGGNGISAGGCRHIAGSSYMSSLLELNLNGNSIGDEGLKVLSESKYVTELRMFSCAGEQGVTHEGVEMMTNSTNFMKLESLFLTGNNIGDAGAFVIAGTENMPKKRMISLYDCGIESQGVRALAAFGNESSKVRICIGVEDEDLVALNAEYPNANIS